MSIRDTTILQNITGNSLTPYYYQSVITEDVRGKAIEFGWGYHTVLYNDGILTSGVDNFLITTPSTGIMTLSIPFVNVADSSVSNETRLTVDLYESATVSANGANTNAVVSNFNRVLNTANQFNVYYNPTITDVGTRILRQLSSSQQTGVQGTSFQLKPSTNYIVKVTNISTVTAIYRLSSDIYHIQENVI